MALDLISWLRSVLANYQFDVAGVFHRKGEHPWPLAASNAEELEQALAKGGHLLPLPKEPAALANVIEVSIVDFLMKAVDEADGLTARRGTERGYPDLEFSGSDPKGFYAVDVKVARRASTATATQTESRITLYTGNTYFRFPTLHWPGTFRPFDEYASHVDIIVIYTLNVDRASRVEDIEVIVQDPWRIASRQRSSTTREYIGAVTLIAALRDGKGEFATPDAFYKFWRSYPFRLSTQVQRQLSRLVEQQKAEIEKFKSRDIRG